MVSFDKNGASAAREPGLKSSFAIHWSTSASKAFLLKNGARPDNSFGSFTSTLSASASNSSLSKKGANWISTDKSTFSSYIIHPSLQHLLQHVSILAGSSFDTVRLAYPHAFSNQVILETANSICSWVGCLLLIYINRSHGLFLVGTDSTPNIVIRHCLITCAPALWNTFIRKCC